MKMKKIICKEESLEPENLSTKPEDLNLTARTTGVKSLTPLPGVALISTANDHHNHRLQTDGNIVGTKTGGPLEPLNLNTPAGVVHPWHPQHHHPHHHRPIPYPSYLPFNFHGYSHPPPPYHSRHSPPILISSPSSDMYQQHYSPVYPVSPTISNRGVGIIHSGSNSAFHTTHQPLSPYAPRDCGTPPQLSPPLKHTDIHPSPPMTYSYMSDSIKESSMLSQTSTSPLGYMGGMTQTQHLSIQSSVPSPPTTPSSSPVSCSGAVEDLSPHCSPPSSFSSSTSPPPLTSSGVKKRKDSNGQRYQCDDCNKSYSTFSGLSKHKQFHCSTQNKKSFSCKYCEKIYVSLGALKMHIRTHTLPCKCKLCGKAFSRPWLLQGHIRTHTGEKPFTCPHCNRAFADRSNLRAHLQTHSDVKKYSCKSCSKTFSRMSLLTKHEDSGCPGIVTASVNIQHHHQPTSPHHSSVRPPLMIVAASQ